MYAYRLFDYDHRMPNKTIYVSDDDLPLYARAQELAGGSLSAAISTALRRFVEAEQGRHEGFDEITVSVGPGRGRRQRFSGVLLGEWARSTNTSFAIYRVYRTRTGKFAVHTERSAEWKPGGPDAEKWTTGWRSWVGNWSSNQSWGLTPEHSTLQVADSIDELRELLPDELYAMVAELADQPAVEDLDI
jgi:EXLDI family protein